MKLNTTNLISTALCIALGLALPFVFHAVGLGSNFLPMFLPVLLCGLCFGPLSGFTCGLICPYLSSSLTGMPPIFPTAFVMTIQCTIFGVLGGILYNKYNLNIYLSLIITLFIGEFVGAFLQLLILGLNGESVLTFISTYILTGLPGIILNIVIVPVLVFVLQKAKLTSKNFYE